MSSREQILEKIRDLKLPEKKLPSVPKFAFEGNLVENFTHAILGNKGQIITEAQLLEEIKEGVFPKIFSNLPEFASLSNQELPEDPHDLQALDLAILQGQFAVAENGAIWFEDENLSLRATPFITQHLVVVVSKENLVTNMHAAYERIGAQHSGFGLFIAGPSKTADIEQSLVIGAHGARSLKVILMDAKKEINQKTTIQMDNPYSNWFKTYSSENSLLADGKAITTQFVQDFSAILPAIPYSVEVVINTTPALVFFDPATKTVNLPFWNQLKPAAVGFFDKMGGTPEEGERLFGLFFNGFYLPHELGHGVQFFVKGDEKGSYANELFANQIGMQWWRKHGQQSNLEQCFQFAQHIMGILPDPVPKGMTVEEYFNENYDKVSSDPFIYGFLQFGQFIKVYEDQNLADFDTLLKNFAAG